MAVVLYAVFGTIVLLHALCAAWLTRSGPRERLWERLALMSTLTTMVFALALLIPAFMVRSFEVNALPLAGVWAGALALEGACVFVMRHASARFAAVSVFVVLFAAPATWLVDSALDHHDRATHWNCLGRN